jgi:hypothetical protein
MLLFGNDTGRSKKGRKPGSGGQRQLRSDFDLQREIKGPSPPGIFMPSKEAEGLRLPRLPTPDSRLQQDDKTSRDRLRPVQDALLPLTHRARLETNGVDGAENKDTNSHRDDPASFETPDPSALNLPPRASRIKSYEEGDVVDGREEGNISRADGRAWEDSEYDNPKDPILNAFKDFRLQMQVVLKGQPKTETKSLEMRLKKLEGQVMADRQSLVRRGKAAKLDTNSLQSNLKAARDNMHATMQQAADDVVALTHKLQDVENRYAECRVMCSIGIGRQNAVSCACALDMIEHRYAQCRVDKDHLERSFQAEMEVLRKKMADVQEGMEEAQRERDEMAQRMRDEREETRKLKRAKAEAESNVHALEEQGDVYSKEVVALKTRCAQLEREVAQLESDVELHKAAVRNEEDRARMEKERHNERLKSLESQLERCMEEAAAVEDYKAEAKDARRKVEQAESLLDEAEAARTLAVKAAQEASDADKQEALGLAAKELEAVKKQLIKATEDKKEAASKAQEAQAQTHAELQAANAKLAEATKARMIAQDQLRQETETLLSKLKAAQEDGARHMQASAHVALSANHLTPPPPPPLPPPATPAAYLTPYASCTHLTPLTTVTPLTTLTPLVHT